MKKAYVKPEIMFESFASSTNIAGNCSVPTNTPHYTTCAYVVKDDLLDQEWHVFLSSMEGICTTSEADDGFEDGAHGRYDKICYETPFGKSLFNS